MFQVTHLSCYKVNHSKEPCKMQLLVLCGATRYNVVFPQLCNALSLDPLHGHRGCTEAAAHQKTILLKAFLQFSLISKK